MYGEIVVGTLPDTPHYKIYEGGFLVFGRGKNADVILDDNAISRVHFKIFYHKKEFWIQDFGSRNNTLVNNEKISTQLLKNNDNIRVGRHKIKFYLHSVALEKSKEEEEGFSQLKRHDKLLGKIAVELNLLNRSDLKRCVMIQETLSEDGDYIHLEDILLQEEVLTSEQIQQINKQKIKVPTSIEGYKLQELIGIGGMGRIYKGRSNTTNEPVAVKILTDIHTEEKMQLSQQFIREAKAVAKLHHNNIVSGIDFGFSGKNLYIVMEYIDGPDMQQYLKEKGGRLLPDEAIDFTIQIAQALEHAHSCNLIHRDIKPENVLLTTNHVTKLCDFGLVKDVENNVSENEKIFGTIAYMSPEQCLFKDNIDIRSDIYSLGVVFYRMVYGELPFTGTKKEIRKSHVQKALSFPENQKGQRKEVSKIISRMMSKKPKDRYQTPTFLLNDLKDLARTFSPLADSNGTSEVVIDMPRSGIDDTATNIFRKMAETQEISKWEFKPLPGKTASFQLLLHLTQRIPVLSGNNIFHPKYLKYIVVGIAILMIGFIVVYRGNASLKSENYYELVVQNLKQKKYIEADLLVKKYRREMNLQDQNILINLQQKLYDEAYIYYQQQNLDKAIELCNMIISWSPQNSIAKNTFRLQQDIQLQILSRNKEQIFWDKLKNIENLIDHNSQDNISTLLSELYTHAQNSEQRKAYDELQQKYELYKLKDSLSNFSYKYKLNFQSLNVQKKPFEENEKITTIMPGINKEKSEVEKILITWDFPFVYALNAANGNIVWFKKLSFLIDAPEQISLLPTDTFANLLLFDEAQKAIYLIEGASGKVLWGRTIPALPATKAISFNDKIYLPCVNQYTYEISLATGQILGGFYTHTNCNQSPTLNAQKNSIYLYCDNTYYNFDLLSKKLKSRTEVDGNIVHSGLVYASYHFVFVEKNRKSFLYSCTNEEGSANLEEKIEQFHSIDGQIQLCYLLNMTKVYIETTSTINTLSIDNMIFTRADKTAISIFSSLKGYKQTTWKIPEGTNIGFSQIIDNKIYIQKKLSNGFWCGLFTVDQNNAKLFWQKRMGSSLSEFVFQKGKLWLSGDDGSLYHGKLEPKNNFEHIPGDMHQSVLSSLTYIESNKDKLLVMDSLGEASIMDFYNGKKFRWKLKIKIPPLKIRPLVYAYKDRYIFSAVKNRLFIWTLSSGKLRYRPYVSSRDISTPPYLFKDSIFIGTTGNDFYKLRLVTKTSKPYLERLWQFDSGGQINGTIDDTNNIYFVDREGTIVALRKKDGRRLWQVATNGQTFCSAVWNKNKKIIYVCNEKGKVTAVSTLGKIIWQKSFDENFLVSPQLSNDYLYVVGNKGNILKLDIEDGMLMNNMHYGDNATFFFRHLDKCYIGSKKGMFYIIDF